jgi:hypothetical protein
MSREDPSRGQQSEEEIIGRVVQNDFGTRRSGYGCNEPGRGSRRLRGELRALTAN